MQAVQPPIPPSPPPPAPLIRRTPVAAKAAAIAVLAVVFARSFSRAEGPDWAAAGTLGMMVTACFFARSDSRARMRVPAGLLACAAMVAAFYRYGAGSFALPAAVPDLDVLALAGVGLAAAGASLYLGLWEAGARDRLTALGLLSAAAAMLFLAACSLRLPAGAAWPIGVRAIMASDATSFVSSGGPWRWGGLLVLGLVWRALRRRAARRPSAQKAPILNWNR